MHPHSGDVSAGSSEDCHGIPRQLLQVLPVLLTTINNLQKQAERLVGAPPYPQNRSA